MEEGSKIQNMDGRGVYADGGKVEIGGAISNIAANESAMWQTNNGIAIHLRNNAEGTLTSTALIEKLSGGSIIYCAGGAKSFKMENGSKITDCLKLNGNVIFAQNSTVVIDGEISNVHATGNHHILQTEGCTAVTIGENGRILNNRAYYGAVYMNGTDDCLDIYGKSTVIFVRIVAAVWCCPIITETTTQPCMKALRSATTKPSKQAAEP